MSTFYEYKRGRSPRPRYSSETLGQLEPQNDWLRFGKSIWCGSRPSRLRERPLTNKSSKHASTGKDQKTAIELPVGKREMRSDRRELPRGFLERSERGGEGRERLRTGRVAIAVLADALAEITALRKALECFFLATFPEYPGNTGTTPILCKNT